MLGLLASAMHSHLQSSHLLAGRCNVSRRPDDALPSVMMYVQVGTELLKHRHKRRTRVLQISHGLVILSFPAHTRASRVREPSICLSSADEDEQNVYPFPSDKRSLRCRNVALVPHCLHSNDPGEVSPCENHDQTMTKSSEYQNEKELIYRFFLLHALSFIPQNSS
jgi:hypothetical protein